MAPGREIEENVGMRLVNTRLLGVLLGCRAAAAQIITTVAGTDYSYPYGSLAAVNAPLGAVTGTAVDAAGNVFVADSTEGPP